LPRHGELGFDEGADAVHALPLVQLPRARLGSPSGLIRPLVGEFTAIIPLQVCIDPEHAAQRQASQASTIQPVPTQSAADARQIDDACRNRVPHVASEPPTGHVDLTPADRLEPADPGLTLRDLFARSLLHVEGASASRIVARRGRVQRARVPSEGHIEKVADEAELRG
jgi:hypothetical protein